MGNFEPVDEESAKQREDERAILQATYSAQFYALGRADWRIQIREGQTLHVCLPPGYPKTDPPNPLIECTRRFAPEGLVEELLKLFTPGEACICQWIKYLGIALEEQDEAKEKNSGQCKTPGCRRASWNGEPNEVCSNCQRKEVNEKEDGNDKTFKSSFSSSLEARRRWKEVSADSVNSADEVEVVRGQKLFDKERTTMYQAFFARVTSIAQVNWVYQHLLANERAAVAHNIAAYRIRSSDSDPFQSDHDDDYETGAGDRLAVLLEKRGAEDVFVMVRRTTSGDYLGPVRFKDMHRAVQVLL